MPPLPAAPGIIKVRLIGSIQASGPWNVGFHLRFTGTAPSVADLTGMMSGIAGLYTTNCVPMAAADILLTGIQSTDLSSSTGATATSAFNIPGTRVGTPFSAQIAMVGSWSASVRWRGGHFRNYWPWGVIADPSNVRTWSDPFITSATAALSALRTGLNGLVLGGAPLTLVGLSRFTNVPKAGTPRIPPVPFPITAAIVHPRLDTQRRRLGKERP